MYIKNKISTDCVVDFQLLQLKEIALSLSKIGAFAINLFLSISYLIC